MVTIKGRQLTLDLSVDMAMNPFQGQIVVCVEKSATFSEWSHIRSVKDFPSDQLH